MLAMRMEGFLVSLKDRLRSLRERMHPTVTMLAQLSQRQKSRSERDLDSLTRTRSLVRRHGMGLEQHTNQ